MEAVAAAELQRFRGVRRLHNHWAGGISPPGYYWYLTFENSPELQALAKRCRSAMWLPYYDFTSPEGLHMTLDRVAAEGEVTVEVLEAVAAAGARACSEVPVFDISVGGLGGTLGAIGFSAFPREPLRRLRNLLREATLSVLPHAPVRTNEFHPHVAIAYCNANVEAATVMAAVEKLSGLGAASVSIDTVALVRLQRQPRAYTWQVLTGWPYVPGRSERPRAPCRTVAT